MSFLKANLIFFILLISIDFIYAQQNLNLDFESSIAEGKPMNWRIIGKGYEVKLDSTIYYSGKKGLIVEKKSDGNFGGVGTDYPVDEIKGKHLRFTGWIKTDNISTGYAGLWLRVDGKMVNGLPEQLGFDNMQNRGPVGTTTWTKYSIEMDISKDAQRVVFGALLGGNGTAWFDNLQVEVINSSEIKNSIGIVVPTQQAIKNIRAFAKLYGYIRFFHPSDEAAQIDWDKFAIYGSEKVKNAKNDNELKETLKQLFLPIAPTAQIYSSNEKPNDISEYLPKDTTDLKVVVWKHYGVGLTDKSPIYESIRLNRDNVVKEVSSKSIPNFAPVTQTIDAKNHRNKEIKLVASVRANVIGTGNNGHLWLRVDCENKQNGFLYNMDDRPIISNEWREYEFTGTVANDAKYISFGGFLRGKGQLWLDDFKLFEKDENTNWEKIEIVNPSFELTNNNKALGWYYEVTGYNFSLVNSARQNGQKCLLIERSATEKEFKLFDRPINDFETIKKEILPGLYCSFPLTLFSKDSITLGSFKSKTFDSLLISLEKIKFGYYEANYENVRLGNVVNAWNVFQHFYPYFDEVKVDWDNVLTETLIDALNDKTSDQFFNTLRKMVAKLQDGHGYVNYIPRQKIGSIPICVEWIENQLMITGSQDSLFQKGDIIEKLDGLSSKDALLNEEQYVSGSTQLKRHRSLNEICDGPLGSIAKFQIIRDGKEINKEDVRTTKKGNLFFNNVYEFEFPSFKKLEDGIYYINTMQVTSKQINDSLQVLAKAIGIIFDERVGGKYPSANEAFQPSNIIQYLIDDTVHSAWWNIPQTIYPDRKDVTYDQSHWTIPPKEPRIKAKIIFINVPSIVSYGESYMGIFEYYKLAEFVGEPTAGTNGNVNFINLPGGFNIMWTGMKVTKQDGSQHHLMGIQPTYPVQRTIKAVKEGRDEYLEKAIEVLKEKIK